MSTNKRQAKKNAKKKGEPYQRMEEFTPSRAAQWVKEKAYDGQRPLDMRWVDHLARQMKKDLWMENGRTIVISHEGKLIDGQHALSAIAKSGKTYSILVAYNRPKEAFKTIDTGRTRTGAQFFAMRGEASATLVAATCRKVYEWETKGCLSRRCKLSNSELEITFECYPTRIKDSVRVANRVRKKVKCDASMIAFVHFLISPAKRVKGSAFDFFEVLETGLTEVGGHPAHVLRERLMREWQKDRRWDSDLLLSMFIRAWNYHAQGKTVRTLGIKKNPDGEYNVPAIRGLGRGQGSRGRD